MQETAILSPRRSSEATSGARGEKQKRYEHDINKIKDFETFCTEIGKRYHTI